MVYRDYFFNLNEDEKGRHVLEQCSPCRIYPCELINGYALYKENNPNSEYYSHHPKELKNGCLMNYGLSQINCGLQYVSEGIGDHYKVNTIKHHKIRGYRIEKTKDYLMGDRTIDRWEPAQPVFISAQTGRGKNTFIEKDLIPYIRELNLKKETRQKILILSNRVALTLQVKDRIQQGIRYKDGVEDKVYSWGQHADVMSYQSFLSNIGHLERAQGWRKNQHGEVKQKREAEYLFVICDEAHFFTSDAMFNPETDRILFHITKIFKNTIRVYITATPYDCLEHILKHEERNVPDSHPSVFYHFKRDYSYLDIKYFSDFDELHEIIEDSGKENWLIFIDNIEKGQEYKTELDEIDSLKGKVYAISAKSKEDPEYQKMIISESINVALQPKKGRKNNKDDASGLDEKNEKIRVLIATSVIDNGVNFRNIQNVVISDLSRVNCVQKLGRARVESGDRVTLYIKRFTHTEITRRVTDMRWRQDAYHDFRTSGSGRKTWFTEKYFLNGGKNFIKPEHWLATNRDSYTTEFLINDIANTLVDTMVLTYEAVLKEMESENPGGLPGQKYLEHQLSWFEHTYEESSDITYSNKNETQDDFFEFIKSYVSKRIYKSEQEDFRKNFTELYIKAFPKRDKNNRLYGISIIKDIFAEHNIGCKIDSVSASGGEESYWQINSVYENIHSLKLKES